MVAMTVSVVLRGSLKPAMKTLPVVLRTGFFFIQPKLMSTARVQKPEGTNWGDIPTWRQAATNPNRWLRGIPHSVVSEQPIPNLEEVFPVNEEINEKISIWNGDLTKLNIDAVVNAANEELMAGGGICGAIHKAAGPELARECSKIPGCPTGSAVCTKGYNLPAKFVIHAVGPRGEKEEDLRRSYTSILDVCKEHSIRSVCMCCISTGIYGYPNGPAAVVALTTVREWLSKPLNRAAIDRVVFCTFLEKDLHLYQSLAPIVFPITIDQQKNVQNLSKH